MWPEFFDYRQGLNYKHGTGHGIGAFLNVSKLCTRNQNQLNRSIRHNAAKLFVQVHEGPVRVAPKAAMSGQLKPGVFFSDEPGYYKASYSYF